MSQFSAVTTEKAFSDSFDKLTQSVSKPRVVVAFSGGADSLSLLLLSVNKLGKDNVKAVYVNHKIRNDKELTQEIELNSDNCNKIGIPLTVVELDKKELDELSGINGVEAAARKLRYDALYEQAEGFDFILTAHHFDDQIETILMKKLRNSPITALRGISPVWGKVIRPLLDIRKKDLEDYVSYKGFNYSIDSTNSCNSYLRNKLRNEVIPSLRSDNPCFEKELLELRENAIKECDGFTWDGKPIDLEFFRTLSGTKQLIVLYSMWDNCGLGIMSNAMAERVIKASFKTASTEVACGACFCICDGKLSCYSTADDRLYKSFVKKLENGMRVFDYIVTIQEDTNDTKSIHLSRDFIDNSNLTVRFPNCGDSISLLGGTKTVAKLLKDMKVPTILRGRTPVLFNDDNVIAVFASVWGKKDRVTDSLRNESTWKNDPCIKFCSTSVLA